MAGQVRQPIDEKAFEKYLSENVPTVKTPIELKQVCPMSYQKPTVAKDGRELTLVCDTSLALASRIPRTRSQPPTANGS